MKMLMSEATFQKRRVASSLLESELVVPMSTVEVVTVEATGVVVAVEQDDAETTAEDVTAAVAEAAAAVVVEGAPADDYVAPAGKILAAASLAAFLRLAVCSADDFANAAASIAFVVSAFSSASCLWRSIPVPDRRLPAMNPTLYFSHVAFMSSSFSHFCCSRRQLTLR